MVVVPRLFEVLRAADPQPGREAGQAHQLSDEPRARDRRQGLCRRGAALGQADGLPARPDAAAQDRGQVRRPDQGDGLGRRAAQSRGRHLLPLARPHPAPGLRPDRIGAGAELQPAQGRAQDGHGRPAACSTPRCKIAEDGEILVPGRAGHAGLLAQRGADRADPDRRLAAHRRRRPYRRQGPDRHHRPQEGHDRQRQGRQCRARKGRGDADPPEPRSSRRWWPATSAPISSA